RAWIKIAGDPAGTTRMEVRMADQDDKKKDEKQSGSGRPGTKFMERPKPGQQKDPSQQQPPQGQIPPAEFEEEEEEDVKEEEGTGGRQPEQGQEQQKKGQQQPPRDQKNPGSN